MFALAVLVLSTQDLTAGDFREGNVSIENKLNRMEDKIDLITEKLSTVDKTLERNTVSLELHIRRTNLLEAEIGNVKSEIDPIAFHVKVVQLILKTALAIAASSGLWAAIRYFGKA